MLVGQGAEAYEDIGQGEIKRRSRGRAIAQRRMHIWPALQRRILRLCTWRCQCHPTGRETFCILPRWDIDAAQLRKAKETLPFSKRSLHGFEFLFQQPCGPAARLSTNSIQNWPMKTCLVSPAPLVRHTISRPKCSTFHSLPCSPEVGRLLSIKLA